MISIIAKKLVKAGHNDLAKQLLKADHSFGCVMARFDKQLAYEIVSFGNDEIEEAIVYTDPSDPSFGRELVPHVTVKYGLHTKDPKEVMRALRKFPKDKVRMMLGTTGTFEQGDYDVVWIGINSSDLIELNKLISDNLKVTDTFPDYKPHATVSYVKKGKGKQFAGNDQFAGEEVVLNKLIFSTPDDKEAVIYLTKGR